MTVASAEAESGTRVARPPTERRVSDGTGALSPAESLRLPARYTVPANASEHRSAGMSQSSPDHAALSPPLIDAAEIARSARNGVLLLPPGARVTPLALEEAWRRGVVLDWSGRAPAAHSTAVSGPTVATADRNLDRRGLARRIDHTLLVPDATASAIDQLCDEALAHSFATVCVNGVWVRRCSEILSGSPVAVCAVIGFPLGAMVTPIKVAEAEKAIGEGAREIDMVLSVGLLKSGDDARAKADIEAVAAACHRHGARLKVILECCLLTDEEKARACRLAEGAGADFVKTSTGFSKHGATVEDVALMAREVGGRLEIKASGGIRDLDKARAMLRAGATRLGTSASVAIVQALPG